MGGHRQTPKTHRKEYGGSCSNDRKLVHVLPQCMPQDPRSSLTAAVQAGHASLLLELRGVAKRPVEPHRLFSEPARQGGIDLISLMKLSGRHFILAAGFEQWVHLAKALPSPEAEQHAIFFSANQQHGAIRQIDQVAPFDNFVQRNATPGRLRAVARPWHAASRIVQPNRRQDLRRGWSFSSWQLVMPQAKLTKRISPLIGIGVRRLTQYSLHGSPIQLLLD